MHHGEPVFFLLILLLPFGPLPIPPADHVASPGHLTNYNLLFDIASSIQNIFHTSLRAKVSRPSLPDFYSRRSRISLQKAPRILFESNIFVPRHQIFIQDLTMDLLAITSCWLQEASKDTH